MSPVKGHCDSFIIIKINALQPFSHGGTVTDPTVLDLTVLRADMRAYSAISKWTRGQPNTKLGISCSSSIPSMLEGEFAIV